MVREEDGEHMVKDKGACGDKYERGNQESRAGAEMKGRVQMIHENQDRDPENGDQRGKNTMSKKGNTQEYSEIGDETRIKQERGEDKVRTRRGQG